MAVLIIAQTYRLGTERLVFEEINIKITKYTKTRGRLVNVALFFAGLIN